VIITSVPGHTERGQHFKPPTEASIPANEVKHKRRIAAHVLQSAKFQLRIGHIYVILKTLDGLLSSTSILTIFVEGELSK
jgi:hypothetical protein